MISQHAELAGSATYRSLRRGLFRPPPWRGCGRIYLVAISQEPSYADRLADRNLSWCGYTPVHLEARRDHPYCTGGIVERVERALSPTPHSIVERVGKVLYHNAVSAVTLSLRAKVTRAGPFPCLALPLQLLVSLRCDVTRPACRARHSDEACPSCLPWFVSCACGVTRPV